MSEHYMIPNSFKELLGAGVKLLVAEPNHEPLGCINCGMTAKPGYMVAKKLLSAPMSYPPDGAVSCWHDGAYYISEVITAPCPVCGGNKLGDLLRKNSGVPVGFEFVKFADILPYTGNEQAREWLAMTIAQAPAPAGMVTLSGTYGTGKTFIGYCLTNEYIMRELPAKYVTASDMLASVRETFGNNSGNAGEHLIQQYRKYKVLVIDEIDRINLTSWAQETLFRVIDGRYQERDRLVTVMISNSTPDQLGATDEWGYLASRMKDGDVIVLKNGDMRGRQITPKWTVEPNTGEVLETY